jgi:hypothetical protein
VTTCASIGCGGDDDDNDNDDDDNDNDNDTAETVWTDPTTSLMWQNGTTVGSDTYVWQDAMNYCAGLIWGGYTGWRLPRIDELRSLVRGCDSSDTGGLCGVTDSCSDQNCWSVGCDGCDPLGGPGPGGAYWPLEISGYVGNDDDYWSSSTFVVSGDNFSWPVNFYDGAIMENYIDNYGNVRCAQNVALRRENRKI